MTETIVDFLYNRSALSKQNHPQDISGDFILPPLKIMAVLIALCGLLAMVFEVRGFADHSVTVYLIRLSSTLISLIVLVLMNTRYGAKKPELLVHLLLIITIGSAGYMVYLLPETLVLNSQVVGLIIFTSALFLSWNVKNQIIVAIYYNIVFASAILLNGGRVYFLPNMYESILFVSFLSFISVLGSSVNFRYRRQLAEKSRKIFLSEKKYRSIFNNSAEGLFQTTPDGKFIVVNRTLVNLLGYDNEEDLINVDIAKDVYKNSEEREALCRMLCEKDEVKNHRLTLKKKDGTEIIVSLNDRIIRDEEGKLLYYEGSIQDITGQVQIERDRLKLQEDLKKDKLKSDLLAKRAEKSNIIKSQFLASMSHEIRTPMNGIIGYLSLVELGAYENQNEMKQFISSAKQSADSLLELINDILDISKIEAGKMELCEVDFNLSKVIDDSVSTVFYKAQEKGLKVYKSISEEIPLHLRGDSTKIRQILINLLGNSVKFTSKGFISVNVKMDSVEDEFITLSTAVEDTGIGIPADKIDSLFKPFSQVEDNSTKKHGGTGLGLVICKEFVTMMGGTIDINSVEGAGTKFIFKLKLKVQKDTKNKNGTGLNSKRVHEYKTRKEPREKTSYTKEIRQDRSGFKILLVEDNIINQKIALRILNDAGYNADVAGNGKIAIEAINKNSYDLVLMDVQMPEMDGFMATSEIRKYEVPKCNIPIVALTAHALPGDKEECLKAGMNDYVPKPINANMLIKIMDKTLGIETKTAEEELPKEENQVFDFQHLDKVSIGDIAFQKEIISTFINDVNQRLQRIESYLAKNELPKLVSEIHTIKGASYSIGAKKMGDEALAVEISAKHNDYESTALRFKKLQDVYRETKEIVKEYLIPV